MKAGLLLGVVLVLSCAAMHAQERVQVFAGYSYARYSVYQIYSGPFTSFNFNGGLGSAAFRITPHVAAEGEIGGAYGSNGFGTSYSFLTFMGGPRISGGSGKFNVFGHALFGGLQFTSNYSNGATTFAMVLGGGVDVWLKRSLGLRLAQADLLLNANNYAARQSNNGSATTANFRFSTGVTFRF